MQQSLTIGESEDGEASLALGQEVCTEKPNELTAIPVLLEALLLKGTIVTIDAMGTHSNIAHVALNAPVRKMPEPISPSFAVSSSTCFSLVHRSARYPHPPHPGRFLRCLPPNPPRSFLCLMRLPCGATRHQEAIH